KCPPGYITYFACADSGTAGNCANAAAAARSDFTGSANGTAAAPARIAAHSAHHLTDSVAGNHTNAAAFAITYSTTSAYTGSGYSADVAYDSTATRICNTAGTDSVIAGTR